MNIEQLIDDYIELEKMIHDHFGYAEDWKVIPMDDSREYYWYLDSKGDDDPAAQVIFAEDADQLEAKPAGKYYTNTIYPQCFLSKYIFRAKKYTMICVNTHTDGNKFLQIFDNSKELKDLDQSFVQEVLAPFEPPAFWAVQKASEKEIIKRAGDKMGYGAVMQLAQECWREYLVEQGYPSGGEFAYGPCVGGTVACGCSGGCDWCGGSGWLTTHVKRIKDKQHA